MIDSDQLFKELLTTFFADFLALFFPELLAALDITSLEFSDKEYFTELVTGERRAADIVAKAKFQGREVFFLTHIENQGDIHNQKNFQQREFFYAADLHRQTGLPVYSIAVLYGNQPKRPHQGLYRMEFPGHVALEFRYRVVQLNQLDWHVFVAHDNPVAAALMAKMRIQPADRPVVKAACFSIMVGLDLTEVQKHLIGGFVDTYLTLNEQEQAAFTSEMAKIEPPKRDKAMELVTSWERKGIAQGAEQGERQGAQKVLLLVLRERLGPIAPPLQKRLRQLSVAQVQDLTKASFKFTDTGDLASWLDQKDRQ